MIFTAIRRLLLAIILSQLFTYQTAQDYNQWSYFKSVEAQTKKKSSKSSDQSSLPPETQSELGRLGDLLGDPNALNIENKSISEKEMDKAISSNPQMKKLLGDVDIEGPLEDKNISTTHIAQGTYNKNEKIKGPQHEFCATAGANKCSQCEHLKGKNKSACIAALEDGFFNLDQYTDLTGLNIEGLVYLLFAGMSMMECKMKMNCPFASSAPTSQTLILLSKSWIAKEIALNQEYDDYIEEIRKYITMINDKNYALKEKENTKENARPKIKDIKIFYALMIIAYKKIYSIYIKKQNLLRMAYAFLYATFALGILEFVLELILILLVIVIALAVSLIVILVYLIIVVIIIVVAVILYAAGIVGGVVVTVVGVVLAIILAIVALIIIAVANVVAVVVIIIIYLYFSPIIPGCFFGGIDSVVAFTTLGITSCTGTDDKLVNAIAPVDNVVSTLMSALKSFDVVLGLLDGFLPTFTLPLTDVLRQTMEYNKLQKALGIEGKSKCALNFVMAYLVFPIGAFLLFPHPIGRGIFAFIHGVLGMFISEIFIEQIKGKIQYRIDFLKKILKYLSRLDDHEEKSDSKSASSRSAPYEYEDEKDEEARLESFIKKVSMNNSKLAKSSGARVCFCNDKLDYGCKKSKESCSENAPSKVYPRENEVISRFPTGYRAHIEKNLNDTIRDFNDITRGTADDETLLKRAGKRLAMATDLKNKAQKKYNEILNLPFMKNNPQLQKALKYQEEKMKEAKRVAPNNLRNKIKSFPGLQNLPFFGLNKESNEVPQIKEEFIQEVKEIVKEEAKKELTNEEIDELFDNAEIDIDVAMPNIDLETSDLSGTSFVGKNADFSKLQTLRSLDIVKNKRSTIFQIISKKHFEKYQQELRSAGRR